MQLMTTRQLCRLLLCSRTLIASLVREGMPIVRLSTHAYRFDRDEVMKWLELRDIRSRGGNDDERKN